MISRKEAKNIAGKLFKDSFNIDYLIRVKERLCTAECKNGIELTVTFGLFNEVLFTDRENFAEAIFEAVVNMRDGSTRVTFIKDDIEEGMKVSY